MKIHFSILFAMAVALSVTSCGNSNGNESKVDSNNAETPKTEAEVSSSSVKEGARTDIDGKKVVKIVTDEKESVEDSFEARDWAAKSGHNVYDFSSAEEIKSFQRVVTTDPAKYEDTDRILKSTNFSPEWSSDHSTVTVSPTFHGVSNTADDVLDMILEKQGYSYTAYMKDGCSIHVKH